MHDATSSTHTNHMQVPRWRSQDPAGHSFGLFRSSLVKKELIPSVTMAPTTRMREASSGNIVDTGSSAEEWKSMKMMKASEMNSSYLDLNLSLKLPSSNPRDHGDQRTINDGACKGGLDETCKTDLSLSLHSALPASTSKPIESEKCSSNREEAEDKKRKRGSALDLTL